MTLSQSQTCAECGEKFQEGEPRLISEPPYMTDQKRYHLRCATLETKLEPSSMVQVQSKIIREILDENSKAKEREELLLREIMTLMEKTGATAEEMENVRAEFYWRG